MTPGEMFLDENNTCYEVENPARNEKRYLEILKSEIDKANVSMPFYSIMDTSRNAVTGIRGYWSNWCNIKEAGFGVRPTADTGNPLLDAFVYAKSGGESDGTSNTSMNTYDSFCGREVSYKPMPERDEWSQEYFEMLLRNAKQKGYRKMGKGEEVFRRCV
jgi:cellulose 1,4-beta-cellobiosidase